MISDLQMPKLDGYQLLEKVRTSKLRRLQEMPFILVSGEETEKKSARRPRPLGVSDFLTKGCGAPRYLTRLDHLLELFKARQNLEGREHMVQDPVSGLFSRKYVELQTAQALPTPPGTTAK